MQYLYVCHFSNGTVKVGRSVSPISRIAQHEARVVVVGVHLVEHFIAECVGYVIPAEAELLAWCRDRVSRVHNEWFLGLDYQSACEFAKQCSEKHYEFPVTRNIGDEPSLLNKVVAELAARTGDLRKVSVETGIPYDTILRVKNSENDPSFSRVAVLYAYLFPQTFTRSAGEVVTDQHKG